MAVVSQISELGFTSYIFLAFFLVATAVTATLVLYTRRIPFPSDAPKRVNQDLPILGALSFFTRRWDFNQSSAHASSTGQYSYFVGDSPVIGLTGDAGRTTFFESRELSLGAGYKRLFAAGPGSRPEDEDDSNSKSFDNYFIKRLTVLVKNEKLARRLPLMLEDSKAFVYKLSDGLDKGTDDIADTDPFESVYTLVFRLTVRTVGCDDIAASDDLLRRVLGHYEYAERGTSTLSFILPWLPTMGKLIRNYSCMRIYLILKKIVDGRKQSTSSRSEKTEDQDDPLQHLIDCGDTTLDMTMFMISAFFAGILNSGINAAAVLCYLASSPSWQEQLYAEILSLANEHSTHPSPSTASLLDKLTYVPLTAWENLPIMDACFRDSIRLQLLGTGFRRNTSSRAVPIGGTGEVIPPGAYATWHFQELHLDPEVYPEPSVWNPGRYMGEEGRTLERVKYAWTGFGAGKHPCAGMRFARLEQNIIIAFFVARFELLSLNHAETGVELPSLPSPDINGHSASKCKTPVRVRYQLRK